MGAGFVGSVNEPSKSLGLLRRKLVQLHEPTAHIESLHIVGWSAFGLMYSVQGQSIAGFVIANSKEGEKNTARDDSGFKSLVGVMTRWNPSRPDAIPEKTFSIWNVLVQHRHAILVVERRGAI